ncbi:DUF2071 domain-containing protein [Clavibacter tessellarius]
MRRPADPVSAAAPDLPGRAVIRQLWSDLAFVHWRVDPALVAPLLPPGTRPDVHDGSSWVGLIPFVLSRSAFPPLPAVPWAGTFAESSTCASTAWATTVAAAWSSARSRPRSSCP